MHSSDPLECICFFLFSQILLNRQSHVVTLLDKETIESISSIRIPIKGFPIPIDSIAALWKAGRTFSRPFGRRNDTAAPSSAEDELQTIAKYSHMDSSIKDSPQAALWTLPEPCGKRNDKAAPSGESVLYQQVSPTHPRPSVDKDLAKNNGSEIPLSLTGLPERPSLLERPNFSQHPAHDR